MADPRVDVTRADAVLIGGGVASATLAALLSELEPSWTIEVLEKLDDLGQESSEGWNNAGTGHSALCELNYTPQDRSEERRVGKECGWGTGRCRATGKQWGRAGGQCAGAGDGGWEEGAGGRGA